MSHPDLIYTSAHLLISFRVSLSLCRLTNTERRGEDGRSGGKVEGLGRVSSVQHLFLDSLCWRLPPLLVLGKWTPWG